VWTKLPLGFDARDFVAAPCGSSRLEYGSRAGRVMVAGLGVVVAGLGVVVAGLGVMVLKGRSDDGTTAAKGRSEEEVSRFLSTTALKPLTGSAE